MIPSLDLKASIKAEDDHYTKDKEKFPLIIFLSGFSDDEDSFLLNCNLPALCDRYRVAACVVGGENKWYLNTSPIEGWEDYICKELPDFLFGNFSKLDQNKLILGGVSMGGYGALYNGLKYWDRFKAVMALSPAIKPDDYIDETRFGTIREKFLSCEDLPFMYLAVGDKDFIYEASVSLDAWLKDNVKGVRYKIVPGYGHNWDLWAGEIACFLDELKQRNII